MLNGHWDERMVWRAKNRWYKEVERSHDDDPVNTVWNWTNSPGSDKWWLRVWLATKCWYMQPEFFNLDGIGCEIRVAQTYIKLAVAPSILFLSTFLRNSSFRWVYIHPPCTFRVTELVIGAHWDLPCHISDIVDFGQPTCLNGLLTKEIHLSWWVIFWNAFMKNEIASELQLILSYTKHTEIYFFEAHDENWFVRVFTSSHEL